MSMQIEQTPQNTTHHIEGEADRAKFLRRVLREDGWSLHATANDDWHITFRRTIKGNAGDADVDVVVRLKDKISIVGKWGTQRSFSDAEEVIVPRPSRAWLNYSSVRMAARFLLAGSHFLICGSAGSTSSSKHGLAFVNMEAIVTDGHVMLGHQSVYVHGRMVCCGSVE